MVTVCCGICVFLLLTRGHLKVPCSKVSDTPMESFLWLCTEHLYICFFFYFIGCPESSWWKKTVEKHLLKLLPNYSHLIQVTPDCGVYLKSQRWHFPSRFSHYRVISMLFFFVVKKYAFVSHFTTLEFQTSLHLCGLFKQWFSLWNHVSRNHLERLLWKRQGLGGQGQRARDAMTTFFGFPRKPGLLWKLHQPVWN